MDCFLDGRWINSTALIMSQQLSDLVRIWSKSTKREAGMVERFRLV